jgi:predicted transglutaminase-like cysteine proteinase
MAAKGYAFIAADWLAPATALPTWHAAVLRHREQRREFQICLDDPAQCRGIQRSLQHVLSRARGLDQEKQIRLINGYVNHRRYRSDRGREDPASLDPDHRLHSHWSTLLEFLTRGGDCEDFASAKYFMLRELGFAADDMRIVVTRERRVRGNHAIVAIRLPDQPPGQRVWLLDTDRIYSRQHYKYRFRYALNESSIWDHESDNTSNSARTEM